MAGLKIVFGAAGFVIGGHFPPPEKARSILDILEQNDVQVLDTAQLYGDSETVLGQVSAGDRFVIDTKARGGFDAGHSLQPDVLYQLAHESLEKLKVKQVDIFYIHAPDESIPPTIWLPVVDKLFKEGVFKRFGVSNFTTRELKEVYDLAQSKSYVLPTVYQGNYNAVSRHPETDLFPTLRELGMAFYAYSPMAGGFLSKTKGAILDGTSGGRYSDKQDALTTMYRTLYAKPTLLEALDAWADAAAEEGVSKAELAYRWVSYHTPLKPEFGDGIIIGARNIQQALGTIQGLRKGPLKASVVKKIDEVWKKVKHEAPIDNFNSFAKSQ